jgi:nucleotide-binding universal stress UspA family protein
MVVVAAIDRTERASDVVSEGAKLAELLDTELHIVHVLSDREYYDLARTNVEERSTGVEKEQVERVAANIADEAAEDIEVPYEAVGLVGEVADQVLDYVERSNAEYLVVGPRKRSPSGKALFGSKAQTLLLNSPVTVVSPPTN